MVTVEGSGQYKVDPIQVTFKHDQASAIPDQPPINIEQAAVDTKQSSVNPEQTAVDPKSKELNSDGDASEDNQGESDDFMYEQSELVNAVLFDTYIAEYVM